MTDTLQRRDFLKLGSGLVAASALSPVGLLDAQEKGKKRQLRKAVMYGTISYKGTVLDKFKALKAAGFEGVEPMSHMNQDEVAKALEETGLKAASVCCNTHWTKPLSHPDERARRDGLEGLQIALKDANRYGATSVLLVPGVVNKEVTFDDCRKRSIAEIRKAIPLAKELGVKIAIENVSNNFITRPEQAIAYLDEINDPQVGWHFDIGNTLRYNDPESWIPVLGKRILKMHFKEFSKLKAGSVRFFEGDNNWKAIMKALDEAGYEGWAITEQPGVQSRDASALDELSKQLDKIFAT